MQRRVHVLGEVLLWLKVFLSVLHLCLVGDGLVKLVAGYEFYWRSEAMAHSRLTMIQ